MDEPLLLPLLLVAGAGLYAIDTFVLTGAEKRVGEEPPSQSVAATPGEEQAQLDPVKPPIDPHSAHAISVAEGPAASPPTSPPVPEEEEAVAPLPNEETAAAIAPTPPPSFDSAQIEIVKVTSQAAIQEAPSSSAAIIGVAQPGAEAQVVSRNAEWVQIRDPGSQKLGWVHAHLVTPQTEATAAPSQLAATDPGDDAMSAPPEATDAPWDDTVAAPLPAGPKPNLRAKKAGKYGWRKKRGRRGVAFRFKLRRVF